MNYTQMAERILERFPTFFEMDEDELDVTNAEINVLLEEEFGLSPDIVWNSEFNNFLVVEMENIIFNAADPIAMDKLRTKYGE